MTAVPKVPGLKWFKRSKGWAPYWVAPARDVKQGFRPKTVNLRSLADRPALLKQRCFELHSELLSWRCGVRGDRTLFDGSVGSLIRLYQTHPDSSFKQIRPTSRSPYLTYLRRIDKELGNRTLDSISGLDLKRWHQGWSNDGRFPSASKMARAVLFAVIQFGVEARLNGCEQLLTALKTANRKIPNPKRREYTVTAAQVVGLRQSAHVAGRPSMALAYSLVFETTMRLWDVIGQWWAVEPPHDVTGPSAGAFRNAHTWFGLRWENIDDNLVLRYVPSKTSAKTGLAVTFPLTKAPMVMEELAHWPAEKRTGPVIVYEGTGQPYSGNYFGEFWRVDRKAAGIDEKVWARDLRASGISEGRAAGVATDDAAKVAGHASTRTTSTVYDRAALEAAERFADARSDFRLGH
jgi:integrase